MGMAEMIRVGFLPSIFVKIPVKRGPHIAPRLRSEVINDSSKGVTLWPIGFSLGFELFKAMSADDDHE